MGRVERLVPDGLWKLFQDVVPSVPQRPQGGGRRRCDDRAVLAAIVFVATTGCTWRQLPPVFSASWQTVHRRYERKDEHFLAFVGLASALICYRRTVRRESRPAAGTVPASRSESGGAA
ncbi:transposase [Streptomyces sp. NPDC041068]|uniref:transposase n=1 Tax=Streptomyces sp. NPDC041068 TaxID=3155130 RepID=UPI0033D4C6A6